MSLLMHPRSKIGAQNHERYILSIDSKDRDQKEYPNPNNYQVELPHEYRRIRRITLLSAEFQNTQYAIDSSNDTFVVTYIPNTNADAVSGVLDEVVDIVQLQHGTYTGTSFAHQIESTVNESPQFNGQGANTTTHPINGMFSCTFNTETRKLLFSHSGDHMNVPDTSAVIDPDNGSLPVIRFDVLKSQNPYDTVAIRTRTYVDPQVPDPPGPTPNQLLGHYVAERNFMWDAMGFTQKLIDYDGHTPTLATAPTVRSVSLVPDPVQQRNFEIDKEWLRPHRSGPVVIQTQVDADIQARTAFFATQDVLDTVGLVEQAVVPADPLIPPETINIPPDRYAILEVTIPSIMQGSMRTTGNHHQAFAKIIFADSNTSLPFGNIYDFISAPVDFQMVNRVNHLGFRLLRPDGTLYDTHLHNHSFSLEILCE